MDEKIQTTIRMPVAVKRRLDEEVNRRKYTASKTTIDRLVQDAVVAMLDANERAAALSVSAELAAGMEAACAQRGVSLAQGITEAVRGWISQGTAGTAPRVTNATPSPSEQECDEQLQSILNSGDSDLIDAIRANLRQFARLAEALRASDNSPAPSDLRDLERRVDKLAANESEADAGMRDLEAEANRLREIGKRVAPPRGKNTGTSHSRGKH
jgi:hypothetical protein